MKKATIGMLGIMAAAMGMGSMPSTVPISSGQVIHHDAVAKDLKEVQSDISRLIKTGHGGWNIVGSGLSPKHYGQLLQSQGRQKWIRKS